MENFDWSSFNIKIAIKANLKAVYDAWTKASKLEKWFLSEAEFSDENKILIDKETNALKGDQYKWIWYLYDEAEYGKIKETNGLDFLRFTFAGNCVVEIKFREEFEYVIVELTQKNIPTDEASKRNLRLGCHNGWSFYLINLKSVLEGGLDLRNKDNRFKPMLNN